MAETWDVLVVDDEPVVRDGIRLILVAEGLRVAAVPDAASALAHPAALSCRLLLCDLMLPDLHGIDLLKKLRAVRPDLPVAMITGYATAENTARALDAGVSDFLPKPFTESELLTVVRHALGSEGGAPGGKSP
jgi:two-component system response regulator HydG